MTELFNWLAEHESGISAIAALITIIAGIAVVTRLVWTRMPGEGLPNYHSLSIAFSGIGSVLRAT